MASLEVLNDMFKECTSDSSLAYYFLLSKYLVPYLSCEYAERLSARCIPFWRSKNSQNLLIISKCTFLALFRDSAKYETAIQQNFKQYIDNILNVNLSELAGRNEILGSYES
jgi:hypothetical protein